MHKQIGSPVRPGHPMLMFGMIHERELERTIEQVCLADHLRRGAPHHRSPMQGLFAWVRARVTGWSSGQGARTQLPPAGELSQTSPVER